MEGLAFNATPPIDLKWIGTVGSAHVDRAGSKPRAGECSCSLAAVYFLMMSFAFFGQLVIGFIDRKVNLGLGMGAHRLITILCGDFCLTVACVFFCSLFYRPSPRFVAGKYRHIVAGKGNWKGNLIF